MTDTERCPPPHQTIREQVSEFHRAFGVPTPDRPTVPSKERVQLRLRLIAEEFCELLVAAGCDPDRVDFCNGTIRLAINNLKTDVAMVDVFDATLDLDYVVEGTRLEFGIDGAPGAAEVHRSNMSKLLDGKPVMREDGKILKGPGFSPPDLESVLKAQGWEP